MSTRDNPCDRMALALIDHAARNAPADLRDRLAEEWLADLQAQSGPLARLRFALGCCWARQVIAHDALALGAAVPAATISQGPVVSMAAGVPALLPRRALVLVAIIALHLAAILAFIYGVREIRLPSPPPDLVGKIFTDPALPRTLPSPEPNFHLAAGPLPRVPTNLDPPQVIEPLGDVAPLDIQPPVHLPPAQVATRVAGGPGKGFPATADFYPPSAIRFGESGVTDVRVCTDSRGRLMTDPLLAVSSGSARLDGGALALAKAGSGHYRSPSEDGTPVAGCFLLRVRFALSD